MAKEPVQPKTDDDKSWPPMGFYDGAVHVLTPEEAKKAMADAAADDFVEEYLDDLPPEGSDDGTGN